MRDEWAKGTGWMDGREEGGRTVTAETKVGDGRGEKREFKEGQID